MIDLTRFADDVFDDPALSDPKLNAFANDHIIRLGLLNTAITFPGMLAATSAAYTDFAGQRVSEATQEAIGEGRTIETRKARAALMERLVRQNNLVAYTFGRQGAVFQLFFPYGLKEYRKAKYDNLPGLMERYMAAAQAHLPPAEVADMQSLADAYAAARTAKLSTNSTTDSHRTARREKRKALTLQLTRNVLLIAAHHVGDRDAFDDYFDLSLLPKKRKAAKNDAALGPAGPSAD